VWTDRMLTTLEQGVRGGRWHTLIDKVYQPNNLAQASTSVLVNEGAAGVDHQTVGQFQDRQLEELRRLEDDLRTDRYRPQAVRRGRGPEKLLESCILMLLSTTQSGDFAFSEFSELPQRFHIVREQVTLGFCVFCQDNCAIVDAVADPVPRDVQFFG